MQITATILITGANGMIGSAMAAQLRCRGFTKLLTPTSQELDLRQQQQVFAFFTQHRPDYVFHLAAIVGGIQANNKYPAKFIYDNTQMQSNVIHAAYENQVKKILVPGSACTYPKMAPQPIPESAFLDGLIEPTNIAYAAAKINSIVMAQSYARQYKMNIVIPMPTNAYGVGDNFNEEYSHVIPALMQRIHAAKQQQLPKIVLWGSGQPLREFIYAADAADAFIFLMENYHVADLINVGTMQEMSIIALARMLAEIIGYEGVIELDQTKPDGAPRKCLDSSKLFALGWQPKVSLQEGLKQMYYHHFVTTYS